MPAKPWRGRLTQEERGVLLSGDGFDYIEDVFATTEALVAAWFMNRTALLEEWFAGEVMNTDDTTRPYGWWIAESPLGHRPPYDEEPEVLARILKNEKRRAAAAAEKKELK
jgi:hypothetical protein